MEYEKLEGKFAKIIYLALFDKFVVNYGGDAYYFPRTKRYQLFNNKTKTFATKKECLDFCSENHLAVLGEELIDHPLAHGLPDCRAISPTMHKYL